MASSYSLASDTYDDEVISERANDRWEDVLCGTAQTAGEYELQQAYLRAMSGIYEDMNPMLSQMIPQGPFERFEPLGTGLSWSFEEFCRLIRKYGTSE